MSESIIVNTKIYTDMSHYRRRPPTEMPGKEGYYIVNEDGVIRIWRFEKAKGVRGVFYGDHWVDEYGEPSLSSIDWWAYLYIPSEEAQK